MTRCRQWDKNTGELQREYDMKTVLDRIAGIDLNHEVKIVTIVANTVLQQYICNCRSRYFLYEGVKATELGINPNFKNKNKYVLPRECLFFKTEKDMIVFQSTAAPATDNWTLKGQKFEAKGGGLQFFTPKRAAKQPAVALNGEEIQSLSQAHYSLAIEWLE